MFKDVVELIKIEIVVDDIGDVIETESKRQVFANRKSIRQTEFYQALSTGLRPEIAFEINSVDYQGERKLIYEDRAYSIIRTFEKTDLMELICEAVI